MPYVNNIDNLTELILGASPNMVTFLITILIKNHGYIYKYIRGFKFAIKKQQNLNCQRKAFSCRVQLNVSTLDYLVTHSFLYNSLLWLPHDCEHVSNHIHSACLGPPTCMPVKLIAQAMTLVNVLAYSSYESSGLLDLMISVYYCVCIK